MKFLKLVVSVLSPIVLAITLTSSVNASGWNDYDLQIDDDYRIFRSNSFEVCLIKTEDARINPSQFLVCPDWDEPQFGPVKFYAVTPSHIYLKNAGAKYDVNENGHGMWDADQSVELFFIVAKTNDEVSGPLSENDFFAASDGLSVQSISWVKPKNPDVIIPTIGAVMMMIAALIYGAYLIGLLAIQNPLVTVSILVAGLLAFTILRRRRSGKSP